MIPLKLGALVWDCLKLLARVAVARQPCVLTVPRTPACLPCVVSCIMPCVCGWVSGCLLVASTQTGDKQTCRLFDLFDYVNSVPCLSGQTPSLRQQPPELLRCNCRNPNRVCVCVCDRTHSHNADLAAHQRASSPRVFRLNLIMLFAGTFIFTLLHATCYMLHAA